MPGLGIDDDVLPYSTEDPLDPQKISFGADSLTIAVLYNSANPLDVDGDGNVEPLDALLVINEINRRRVSREPDGALTVSMQGSLAFRFLT